MTVDDRQAAILHLVREIGFLAIEDLAARFSVTPQTIRRDVNQLCDRGLTRRHHGGVGRLEFDDNLDFERRRMLRLDAKAHIGRAVADLIPSGTSLFLGIGTTPEQVALALHAHTDLTVVTNNLGAAAALCNCDSHTIVLPGGKLRNRHRDMVGEGALSLFRSYRVEIAVFGVGGIDKDGTLLDFDPDEVAVRYAMSANARHRILVADRGKFEQRASARGGALSDVETFVSDASPPDAARAAFAHAGVRVVVAEHPSDHVVSGNGELEEGRAYA